MKRLLSPAVQKSLGFLLFFAALIPALRAEDGPFAQAGTAVSPSGQTQVRLVSETVTLQKDRDDVQARWDSVFLSADQDADVTMGFPADPEATAEKKRKKAPEKPFLQDFTVTIDGQKTDPQLEAVVGAPGARKPVFHRAFVWAVHLSKGVPLHVLHTYRFKATGHAVPGRYKVVDYVRTLSCPLTLGNLWTGVPDTVDVTLDLGRKPPEGLLEASPPGYKDDKGVLQWSWKGAQPGHDIRVTLHSAYRDQISEAYLRRLIGLGRPGFRKQKALMKLDAMEKVVIKTRFREPKECVAQNIAIIESMERRLVRE